MLCVKYLWLTEERVSTHSLVNATNGQLYQVEVLCPLGEPVSASFGLLGDGKTAV